MNYGTISYSSASYGGSPGSDYTLLPYMERGIGEHDGQLEFTGDAQLFSLFLRKSAEGTDVLIEAFTRNDLNETPQSQGTFGGLFAQHIIPAARYISVRATLGQGEHLEVRGRSGD